MAKLIVYINEVYNKGIVFSKESIEDFKFESEK